MFIRALFFSLFLSFPAFANQKVCFKIDHCLDVTLATTTLDRQKGLMNQKYLPPFKGLLMVFNEPQWVSIWMKNTFISLDIIWVDQFLKIVDIQEKATPLSKKIMTGQKQAKYIIEMNAGLVDQWNISIGNLVTIHSPLIQLK